MGLIGISLLIMFVLVVFSLVLGNDFIGGIQNVGVDNTAITNGSATTYVVPSEDVLFFIDVTILTDAGISLLVTIIVIASITGIQVLGSGLNAQSVRIIVMLTGFIGIWTALTILALNLILTIEVFGLVIYITITITYIIGVARLIGGA